MKKPQSIVIHRPHLRPLVMKFGGASVATPESFSRIADIITYRLRDYPSIAVVVSAMGNTTDQLIELSKKVNATPPQREYDMLVSVGERISISLLAMALAAKQAQAVSFTGSQSGIITTNQHANAKIVEVRPWRILPILKEGKIAIVAGFQGVSQEGEITTLGRGGSDTTAVALALAIGAEKVEFFKDVAGIFHEDPKINPQAEFFENLTYEQALDITRNGAKILHPRSISLAMKNFLPLQVRSFYDYAESPHKGTWIRSPIFVDERTPVYEVEE